MLRVHAAAEEEVRHAQSRHDVEVSRERQQDGDERGEERDDAEEEVAVRTRALEVEHDPREEATGDVDA